MQGSVTEINFFWGQAPPLELMYVERVRIVFTRVLRLGLCWIGLEAGKLLQSLSDIREKPIF